MDRQKLIDAGVPPDQADRMLREDNERRLQQQQRQQGEPLRRDMDRLRELHRQAADQGDDEGAAVAKIIQRVEGINDLTLRELVIDLELRRLEQGYYQPGEREERRDERQDR